MSFELAVTLAEALPIIVDGAEFIFKAVENVTGIRPNESVQLPTGYKVTKLPDDHCLELTTSEHLNRKSTGISQKHTSHVSYGKDLTVQFVNYGKQIIDIVKGEPLAKGILKAIKMLEPIVGDEKLIIGSKVKFSELPKKQNKKIVKKNKYKL